jgi:transcriptional regulator of acetoin/glycerol metabolism
MVLFSTPETRLGRRRVVDRAWQLYVQDGVAPAGLSDHIAESWRRARESYGIDPAIVRPIRALSDEAVAERGAHDHVLRLATPILRDFSARLALSGHVLAWFDGDGWMLTLDGDRRVITLVRDIEFRPGANWAEESAGTNGPGTALASGEAVEVFASEHFVAAWQRLSCAAAPVRAPGQAAPVGVVDITGPWEVQRRQALLVAKAISRAVEERLRAAVNVRDEVVKHTLRAAHESGDALVAVDATGQVIAANDAATRRRIVEAGALPAAMRRAVPGALRAASRRGEARVELDDGPAFVASAVEYEGTHVGAIIRVAAPPTRSAPHPRARPTARYDFTAILGHSCPLTSALALARKAAHNDLPVIVFGESGTGKELFAHAIHAASRRRDGPFVAINCGAIPAQLVEAELFGYEAGTFTGARREGNAGKFETADGGTLFLDEISELPLAAQAALLRVVQEEEVVRLGSSTPRPLDVRIVAATNKALETEIAAGRFRRDLHYRLNVLSIAVPPLRDRGDDVELLARVFLADAEAQLGRQGLALSDDALAAMRAHRWPGNVRELRNVIFRAAATAAAVQIRAEDLTFEGSVNGGVADDVAVAAASPSGSASCTLREAVRDSERDALLAALEACVWNYTHAARQLGISRATLYRMAQRCGIARPRGDS